MRRKNPSPGLSLVLRRERPLGGGGRGMACDCLAASRCRRKTRVVGAVRSHGVGIGARRQGWVHAHVLARDRGDVVRMPAGAAVRPQRLQRGAERRAFGLLAALPPAGRTRPRPSAATRRCCAPPPVSRIESNCQARRLQRVVAVAQAVGRAFHRGAIQVAASEIVQVHAVQRRRVHAAGRACVRR